MGSSILRIESLSSSSSSLNFDYNHDVFLSFRGEDTRYSFTSHLHMALLLKEVSVFIDNKLEKGEQISESLLKSIEASRISIVILSEKYATSSWCLDELVKIIECMRSKGQLVFPVFYNVDPSEVRKQNGKFGEALAKHEANKLRSNRIQLWKEASTIAANLSGWHFKTGKDEAELIQEIVKKVLFVVNPKRLLSVAKYPVGIDSRLREIEELVSRVGSNGVNMLGMYGIGGIGKTTLAKALYNNIASQFEGYCFLQNVSQKASKHDLAQLQEMLLNEILKDFYPLKVGNRDEGINIIKSRLGSKKVLIVFDDVDHREQLEALAGGRDWFGRGSKIIVTTRNKHLLTSHGFDEKQKIQELNQDHALELFSWHAFNENHSPSNYLSLSEQAIGYCKGLSLALVVLGSFLRGRNQAEWSSILYEFTNSLRKDIKDILRLSFDGLEDRVKNIFLDISCFFVGEKVNCAKKMLNECHSNLDFGINIELMDLSLITIENDEVQMHDLMQQMGRDMVYSESPDQPGKRSRLWLSRDVLEVFTNNSGTDAIKAIKLEYPNPTRLNVDPQAFRNMKNLKLLIVQNVRFSTKIEYLPDSLKWIQWHGFYQTSLPSHFIMKNLVGLDLQHSFIKKFGRLKVGDWLKYVNLSNSSSLKKIFDLSAASNLEELHLKNCTKLRTIDKSVFSLVKLTILNLYGCCKFKKLPTSRIMLPSLERLDLSCCIKLEKIPDFSSASNLEYLNLKECKKLRTIHKSVFSLHKLIVLDLHGCCKLKKLPTSRFMLMSLSHLDLSYCKQLKEIPDLSSAFNLGSLYLEECTNLRMIHQSIGCLDRLVVLNLRRCINLVNLPTHLSLKYLEYLNLSWCCKLQSFPTIDENMKSLWYMDLSFSAIKDLPSSIGYLTELSRLNLSNCTSLISLPDTVNVLTSLLNLELRNCKSLQEIPNLPENIQTFDANGCESLSRNPDNIVDIISKKQDVTLGEISREFIVMNTGIPKWFSYKTRTNLVSASFRHYPDMERTLAACVHFQVNGDSSTRGALISCTIFVCNKLHSSFLRRFLPSKSEYLWLVTTSLAWGSIDQVEYWNKVLVWFEIIEADFEVNVSIKSYGVHVTEELLHGKQMDLNWPLVNYADFYQWEKLQNLDVEDVLIKRYFQEMSCTSNSQAMLHAASYDTKAVMDSKIIQPMIFPLHVTYNGDTVISGMKGMGDTAVANSLRNKFGWTYDDSWGKMLDECSIVWSIQGRKPCSSANRGMSKRYYITFQNVDAVEYRDVNVWVREEPRWFGFDYLTYQPQGEKNHAIITWVDPSLWHPRGAPRKGSWYYYVG